MTMRRVTFLMSMTCGVTRCGAAGGLGTADSATHGTANDAAPATNAQPRSTRFGALARRVRSPVCSVRMRPVLTEVRHDRPVGVDVDGGKSLDHVVRREQRPLRTDLGPRARVGPDRGL